MPRKVKSVEKVEEAADAEPVVEAVVEEVPKVPKKRTKMTPADTGVMLDEIFTFMEETIAKYEAKNKTSTIRVVKNIRRKLLSFQKVFKRVCLKQKRKSSGKGGFQNPVKISDELADFLKVKRGDLIPRTLVTRLVCRYIRPYKMDDKYEPILNANGEKQYTNERNLQDGNTIKPDAALTKLLGFSAGMKIPTRSGEEKELKTLTYATMQILLSKHFIKTPAVVAEAPVAAPVPVVETVAEKPTKKRGAK